MPGWQRRAHDHVCVSLSLWERPLRVCVCAAAICQPSYPRANGQEDEEEVSRTLPHSAPPIHVCVVLAAVSLLLSASVCEPHDSLLSRNARVPPPPGEATCGRTAHTSQEEHRNLVDPASSHMLVSRIKPCMSKYEPLIR